MEFDRYDAPARLVLLESQGDTSLPDDHVDEPQAEPDLVIKRLEERLDGIESYFGRDGLLVRSAGRLRTLWNSR